MSEHLENIVYL